ncbi:hypothetical protein TNCV_2360811 [Trichonephila clavipes]|nr:hypothetical protein TNCV_2360811 [Trichonephila clavipes]
MIMRHIKDPQSAWVLSTKLKFLVPFFIVRASDVAPSGAETMQQNYIVEIGVPLIWCRTKKGWQLPSAIGEKFISTAAIAIFAFLPYRGSENVMGHRSLPMKLRVLGLIKGCHPQMSWWSTGQSRST